MSRYLGGLGFILFIDQYLCPGIWVDLGSFCLQISSCVQVFGWTWVHSVYRSVLVSRYLGGLWVHSVYRSVLVSR